MTEVLGLKKEVLVKESKITEEEISSLITVSYTHLRAHETLIYLVCRLLLENFKTLTKLTEVLGLKKEVLVKESKITEEEISSLINERLKAKMEKNYAKADEIRNFLKEKGIELIDQSKEITTWIRV